MRPPRRFLSHAEARRARRCRLQAKRGQPGRSTGFKSPGVLFEVAGRTSLCHSVWMVRSYSWLRYTVTWFTMGCRVERDAPWERPPTRKQPLRGPTQILAV